MLSNMLCVNPSLPIFNCRLDLLTDSTNSLTSSAVNGSPSISSLVETYLGPVPGKYGPGFCTGFTPFLFGGGNWNESNSFNFFLLGGSGALPVHGRPIVVGPNGEKAASRSFSGFAFGASV